ncbi:hypothetical protein DL240_00430 [Lujinxingia litoralis]|uniref:TonB C-terminal domain-containing protein n=1 Tax=Lujinxingia litoralis TaxID=2211119 RepID=A0A328CAZ9_9DELT|nr:hypothetical protein [Lujinxingia litoralis]RAL24710.1 hypothetical protein DL240_00430 [Lujinxingia litoralis]
MQRRTSQIASQVAAMAMCFAVGLLLGPRLCAPPTPDAAEPVECPPPTERIVEVCPEAPAEREKPSPQPAKPSRPAPVKKDPPLPPSPPPTSAEDRQRLLSWARDQSLSLQGCPRDTGKTYRLSVHLELAADRTIEQVNLNAGPEELSEGLSQCLQRRIAAWKLPDDVAPSSQRLVFGLTL